MVVDELQRFVDIDKLFLENFQHLGGGELLMGVVGDALDRVPDRLLHLGREDIAVVLLEEVADAALARLGVDPDDVGLVDPADVGGVDREVGDGPVAGVVFLPPLHPLGNRVLVGAGEGGEDQLPGVGLAVVDLHPGDPLVDLADGRHIREVQFRVDPLGEEVHRQRDDVDVAGPLAVAEEGPFNPVGAGQQPHLRVGDGAAPVVVGVEGDDDRVAVFEVVAHILDLVGVDVGHRQLDGDREVDDRFMVGGRLPDVQDGVADLQRVVGLGAGEGLGGVFKPQVGVGILLKFLRQVVKQLGARDGDFEDFFLGFAEDLLPLGEGGGVVEVDNRLFDPAEALEGLADDVFPGLGQHLDGDVVGDQVPLDQLPEELVLGFAGRREADFDLLKADFGQELEKFQLLFQVHRDDQRLVAVPQVDRAPDGGLFDVVLLHPPGGGVRDGVILAGVLLVVHGISSFQGGYKRVQ